MQNSQMIGCGLFVLPGALLLGVALSLFGVSSVSLSPSVDVAAPGVASITSPDDLSWDPAMYDVSQGDYAAPRAAVPPVVDGVGDDAAWASAEWRSFHYLWLGEPPLLDDDFMGRYKIVWTPERLYYLVEIYDNMLSDVYPDPLDRFWEDDALEVFLDEDHSGGWHQYNHSAFAYHISLSYDVVDLGIDRRPVLFNDYVFTRRVDNGHLSTWEFSILVFDDQFDQFSADNVPVELVAGKQLGYALAYCDSDETGIREQFIGSFDDPEAQDAWINASLFGTLTLIS